MNSALYGNTYPIPKQILNKLNSLLYVNPTGNGIKRAKNLVKSGNVTYQQLKRLKNFFDTFDSEKTAKSEYDFAGGDDMKYFVESTLERERDKSSKSTELKRPIMSLAGIHALHAQDGNVQLKEEEDKTNDDLNLNALCIIFNNDMKVLLLQRSSYEDQWMPNKFALVGGGVDKNEEAIDAIKREIKEETGLTIDTFIEKFVIQRNDNNVEHIFIGKYNGNDDDVVLNKEHQNYGWYDVNDIENLDIVPNLLDYVRIAVEKYE